MSNRNYWPPYMQTWVSSVKGVSEESEPASRFEGLGARQDNSYSSYYHPSVIPFMAQALVHR